MKKKSLIIILSLFLINFASAASLSDLLNQIDSSSAILGSIFLISFFLSNIALSRAFKGQKGISGLLSFIVSFMIIYTLNRSGFGYDIIYYKIFSGIGLPTVVGTTFLPFIILIGIILIIWKFSLSVFLIIIGTLIILYGVFFSYDLWSTIILGGIFITIGIAMLRSQKKKKSGQIIINP
ncbi:MAG: hypothetical protein OQK82_06245 [Candidatus Pacearchaeota archaeon]|nr:hypothetical protein [Candidatus Pacearchaeota archaeon]